MPLKSIIPIAAVAAVAAAAPAAPAPTAAEPGPLVAYDIGGGEEDYNVVLRSLDGSTHGTPIGPVRGDLHRGPSGPRFSPDGERLLFGGHHELDRDARSLWTRAVDGGRLERVPVRLRGGILRGWDWSPNGRRIVFSLVRGGVSKPGTLYTVRLDGTGLRRLTRGQYPTWSQAGGRIVFERPGSVHVVRPDGERAERVAKVRRSQYRTDATISPDGRTVLYRTTVRGASPEDPAKGQWRTVDRSTGEEVVIREHVGTPGAAQYGAPVFTPDGTRLITAKHQPAVSGGPEGRYDIVTMDTAGKDERIAFALADEHDGRFPDLDLQP